MSTNPTAVWVFTINNPVPDELKKLYEQNADKITYMIAQMEKGDEGTPHLQGYLILAKRSRLTALKKLHATAHWENRKGSHQQAKDYCTKEDTRIEDPVEFGIEPVKAPGKRSDLDAFKEAVKDGVSNMDLLENHSAVYARYTHFTVQYKSAIAFQKWKDSSLQLMPTGLTDPWQNSLYRAMQLDPESRRIHWVWSNESATGKTQTMTYFMKDHFPTLKAGNWKMQDTLYPYDGEKIIWFNISRAADVNENTWNVLELFSDGGPMLSTKYQPIQKIVHAHIVVTCNIDPEIAHRKLPSRVTTYHAVKGGTVAPKRPWAEAFCQ